MERERVRENEIEDERERERKRERRPCARIEELTQIPRRCPRVKDVGFRVWHLVFRIQG
jgi:hypothetical protein